MGNGFFKPNISTIVGDFYDDNDPRKDSAFNIFYMGINLGAILGPFLAGWLGENVDWGWGYFSAGVGLVISVFWMRAKETTLEQYGLPPNSPKDKFVLDSKDWREIGIYSIGLIVTLLVIIFLWGMVPPSITTPLITLGFIALLVGLSYIIFKGTESQEEWSR
ncbi:MAG: POT-type proton-dependent oligopeptide transporter, partial [Flavobacteriales bacterium]